MGKVLRGIRNVLLLARANPVVAAIVLFSIGGCWYWTRTKQARAPVLSIESVSGRKQADNPAACTV